MAKDFDQLLKSLFTVKDLIAVSTQETKVNLYDFEFRQYFETKALFSASKLPLILRVGAIADYAATYNTFNDLGLTLINSVAEHERASLLPQWYPLIKDFTARSKCYDTLPTAEAIMQDFELPVFIKGERQTNRHKRSLCIAETQAELEQILALWKDDSILSWQRLICRAFIQLEKIGDSQGDQLQFSNEHRVFVWRNQVVAIGQYWVDAKAINLSEADYTQIKNLAEQVAERVDVPFLVVDIAKQAQGGWIVIELNDAQESGYAGVSKLKLWETILQLENDAIAAI